MKKAIPILIAVLLTAFTVREGQAKSYELNLVRSIAAGAVQIPPGAYRLEVKEGKAILTNTASGKSFQFPVKVTNTDEKFKDTSVQTSGGGNSEQLKSIQLGGSKVRLEVAN
jgi:hypothetical protein